MAKKQSYPKPKPNADEVEAVLEQAVEGLESDAAQAVETQAKPARAPKTSSKQSIQNHPKFDKFKKGNK